MTERLLQFIWQFQYYNSSQLTTPSGESLQIMQPGLFNHHQGPDFSDARIRIGTTVWAGNVEIHVRTSDWDRHGHSGDVNYDNVVLHVVWENDSVYSSIAILELKSRVPKHLLQRYEELMMSPSFIACETGLPVVEALTLLSWKDRLLAERLLRKAASLKASLVATNGHWEESFWRMLARNFGMQVNADSFEAMAKSLPIKIINKHRNQIHQLEALILGQAGLLDKKFTEEYPVMLQREYKFLKRKYALSPIHAPIHFLRMRPGKFPTVRLAQLSMLLYNTDHLFSDIRNANTVTALRSLFNVTANDYWHYHYLFDKPVAYKVKAVGESMIDNLIINTVCPVLFEYGNYYGESSYKDKAIDWLNSMPPEETTITRAFRKAGVSAHHAADTKALFELKGSYCDQRRCLDCAIGNAILGQ